MSRILFVSDSVLEALVGLPVFRATPCHGTAKSAPRQSGCKRCNKKKLVLTKEGRDNIRRCIILNKDKMDRVKKSLGVSKLVIFTSDPVSGSTKHEL